MKKTFTKEYILSNKGCYSRDEVKDLKCIDNKVITLKQLFRDLPMKDFSWFLIRKCNLTLIEKRKFALHCAKHVLPFYEKRHPEDKKVRECIEATQLYLDGKITLSELSKKRTADITYDANNDTYAANNAAYAVAGAVAAASADTDIIATTNAYAAAAAATTAYADSTNANIASYRKSIWEFIKTLK